MHRGLAAVHELSMCEAIIDTVLRHADGRPVGRVDVRIGHLRQVVPDALQFAWELAAPASGLGGCLLEVEHVPAVIRCRSCSTLTELGLPVLLCGTCESSDVEVVQGDELQIASIDVVEEVC